MTAVLTTALLVGLVMGYGWLLTAIRADNAEKALEHANALVRRLDQRHRADVRAIDRLRRENGALARERLAEVVELRGVKR